MAYPALSFETQFFLSPSCTSEWRICVLLSSFTLDKRVLSLCLRAVPSRDFFSRCSPRVSYKTFRAFFFWPFSRAFSRWPCDIHSLLHDNSVCFFARLSTLFFRGHYFVFFSFLYLARRYFSDIYLCRAYTPYAFELRVSAVHLVC